jgi:hypothetical protein
LGLEELWALGVIGGGIGVRLDTAYGVHEVGVWVEAAVDEANHHAATADVGVVIEARRDGLHLGAEHGEESFVLADRAEG